jgi:hypothetical protein
MPPRSAFLLAALPLLCGCAGAHPLRLLEAPSATASPCRPRGDCSGANRRQQYDPVAGRYYWQDPRTGRTRWENGSPRT